MPLVTRREPLNLKLVDKMILILGLVCMRPKQPMMEKHIQLEVKSLLSITRTLALEPMTQVLNV